MRTTLIFILMLILFACDKNTNMYFVSPMGLDTNAGSLEKPFKSFDRAVAAIAKFWRKRYRFF